MRYGSLNRRRILGTAAGVAFAAAVLSHGVMVLAQSMIQNRGTPRPTPGFSILSHRASEAAPPVCDLRHPIGVRVVPLDTPQRGGLLRTRVEIDPEVDLDNVRVVFLSPGGGAPLGPTRDQLGAVSRGQPASSRFSLRLPVQGHRFLLQFLVEADGPQGRLARLATFNVLPDGPADPGKVVTTPEGARLREYAARRIGQ